MYVNKDGFISIYTLFICMICSLVIVSVIYLKLNTLDSVKAYKELTVLNNEIIKAYNMSSKTCQFNFEENYFSMLDYYEYLSKEEFNEIVDNSVDFNTDYCGYIIKECNFKIVVLYNKKNNLSFKYIYMTKDLC